MAKKSAPIQEPLLGGNNSWDGQVLLRGKRYKMLVYRRRNGTYGTTYYHKHHVSARRQSALYVITVKFKHTYVLRRYPDGWHYFSEKPV